MVCSVVSFDYDVMSSAVLAVFAQRSALALSIRVDPGPRIPISWRSSMTSRARPSISIVMPTYNRAGVIMRAVTSVRDQTRSDWELLIVDDGSKDRTAEVVAGVGDSRIRYVPTDHAGACAARNVGVAMSEADILTFLDSDDEALPCWVDTMITMLDGGRDLASAGFEEVEPDGATRRHEPQTLVPLFPSVTGCFIHSGTYAMRRSLFDAAGGFAEDLPASQHTEFSYRFLQSALDRGATIEHDATAVIRYYARRHDGIRGDDRARLAAVQYMLDHHGDRLRTDPRHVADLYAIAGVRAARLGDYPQARRYLRCSVQAQPRSPRRWARLVGVSLPWTRDLWRRPAPADR